MPVIGSSFALSVLMAQEGEMRRSVAREGVGEADILESATLIRIVISGADWRDIFEMFCWFDLGWRKVLV